MPGRNTMSRVLVCTLACALAVATAVTSAPQPPADSIFENMGGFVPADAFAKVLFLERLDVYWPVSRTTQTFTSVAVDRRFRITEGAAAVDAGR
jgi:hypothetical protein